MNRGPVEGGEGDGGDGEEEGGEDPEEDHRVHGRGPAEQRPEPGPTAAPPNPKGPLRKKRRTPLLITLDGTSLGGDWEGVCVGVSQLGEGVTDSITAGRLVGW